MKKTEIRKRWLALFLSLAMAVTLLPTQMAYAEGAVGDSLPEKLVYFSFDENVTDGGNAKGVVEPDVTSPTIETGKIGNAISLDTGKYLKITNKGDDYSPLVGKEAITISYWSKSWSAQGWAYFIKGDDNHCNDGQNYTAIMDKAASVTTERYQSGDTPRPAHSSITVTGNYEGWKKVTVVLDTAI